MPQRGIVLQLQLLVGRKVEALAKFRHQLGLLHRVDAQVRLHVQIQLQHLGRISGARAHQRHHLVGHWARVLNRLGRNNGSRWRCGYGRGVRLHVTDHVAQRRVILQLQLLVGRQVEALTQLGHQLGLLHRVDAQVGLHIEVQLQHLGRIPGAGAHQRDNLRREITRSRLRRRIHSRRSGRAGVLGRNDHAATQPHVMCSRAQRRIVLQSQIVGCTQRETNAHLAHELSLHHRVDAQVRFHIQVRLEHLNGQPRPLGGHAHHLGHHVVVAQLGGQRLRERGRPGRLGKADVVGPVGDAPLGAIRKVGFHHAQGFVFNLQLRPSPSADARQPGAIGGVINPLIAVGFLLEHGHADV